MTGIKRASSSAGHWIIHHARIFVGIVSDNEWFAIVLSFDRGSSAKREGTSEIGEAWIVGIQGMGPKWV